MYKKLITILFLSFIIISCQSNKLLVHEHSKLYDRQLKESLDSKKLEDAKYILENSPKIKSLNYYKYLVKFNLMTDKLNDLEKNNNKEKNLFVKNYLQALIYTAKGIYYFDDALKSFYKALEYKGLYFQPISELYYNISLIEVKKENIKNAMTNIELAEKIMEDEKYIVLKSYILMKSGKYREAQSLLNKSFNKITEAKNLRKALNIMSITFNILTPMPKELKTAYAKWLTVVQSGKNLQTVLKVAKEGMYEYPNYSEMFTLAGLASYLLDSKSSAVNYFDKAISINKDLPFNYIQLGVIYWNLKQYAKAEEYFKIAISMNKYLPEVYSYLSKLENQSGNFDSAVKYQEFALKFSSNIEQEMILVKYYNKVKKLSETKELLERIIKKYPNNKKPYHAMVKLYNKIMEKESNPDIKILLRKKQLYYEKLYEEKDEEESKRRLVSAEIEHNEKEKK